ncbi:dihydropteroate synthase, partial [Rubrivirga sp.]|uniref:dihydropteroate synthase n=1 Tax=Rubrivirga sp. TaxID=1885344 RepID=UPI003C74268D
MTATAPAPPRHDVLDCRGRVLEAAPGAGVMMGVLNVTPDSFSDGGRYQTVQAALERAGQMADEGAEIIDVGGESTRPGAARVGLGEELERVVPVVEAIARDLPHVLVSVDTSKGAVAREALRAGAHMVNDVTGLRDGVGTAVAAAEYQAPLIVMHSLEGVGGTAPDGTYRDVVEDVARDLGDAAQKATALGVPQVVVDPGFGFGKTVAQNLRLIEKLDRLVEDGRPVLAGVSRKSTIGTVLG